MTFRDETDPLFKHAVTWQTLECPDVKMFNFFKVELSWELIDFEPRVNFTAPYNQTTIKSDTFCVNLKWSTCRYGNKMFVACDKCLFCDAENQALEYEGVEQLQKILTLLLWIFRTKRPELKRDKFRKRPWYADSYINMLNTAINTIRFELIFGIGLKECLVCQNWSKEEVCEVCSSYSDEEVSSSSSLAEPSI